MARPWLPACLAGAGHRQQERGAERLALGERPGLDEQRVGPLGVGRDGRQVGLQQAVGEGAVDLGEPVLAVAGQERLGLGAGQRLGRGELAGGQLDGRQLGAELRRPAAPRARPSSAADRTLAGRVELAREPQGRAPDHGDVGLRSSAGVFGALGQGRRAPCPPRRTGPPASPRRSRPAARAWPARAGRRAPAGASGSADRAMGPSPITAVNVSSGIDLRTKACLTAISFAGGFDAAPDGESLTARREDLDARAGTSVPRRSDGLP